MDRATDKTVDDYIAGFPEDVQDVLHKIRATIRQAAPDAEETISYQIPTFKLGGKPLVYFAAFKEHVSVYPAPVDNAAFGKALAAYASGKGTAKFGLDKPIPFNLISEITRFRTSELAEKTQKEPESDFPKISKPALRALNGAGYFRLEHLTHVSKTELSELHGIGPKALAVLEQTLAENGLALNASEKV